MLLFIFPYTYLSFTLIIKKYVRIWHCNSYLFEDIFARVGTSPSSEESDAMRMPNVWRRETFIPILNNHATVFFWIYYLSKYSFTTLYKNSKIVYHIGLIVHERNAKIHIYIYIYIITLKKIHIGEWLWYITDNEYYLQENVRLMYFTW